MSDDDVPPQRYGRVVIVGGGCYGSYYVRQMSRAIRAGAVEVRELMVVDRDPDCTVARDCRSNGSPVAPQVKFEQREWRAFFDGIYHAPPMIRHGQRTTRLSRRLSCHTSWRTGWSNAPGVDGPTGR